MINLKKYFLRGQRKARYHDRILSNEKKFHNLVVYRKPYDNSRKGSHNFNQKINNKKFQAELSYTGYMCILFWFLNCSYTKLNFYNLTYLFNFT